MRKKEGFSYYSYHKCSIHYCPNKRMSTDFYCQSHHDAFKDIRDDYNGGSTSGYGNKSNTGGKSKKSTAQDDYYGTKAQKTIRTPKTSPTTGKTTSKIMTMLTSTMRKRRGTIRDREWKGETHADTYN